MIELLTPAEMAEADRLAIAGGTPGIELMENAGRAVADAVARRSARRTAGPGRGRPRQQWRRRLCRGADPRRARLSGPACCCWATATSSRAMRRWRPAAGTGRSSRPTPRGLAGAELIVDALFGAGLDRPVEGAARAMIEAMNACGRADPRGRSAERHQRHKRSSDGSSGPSSATASRSSAASPAICCCRDGCIAGRSRSPTSAFRTSVLADDQAATSSPMGRALWSGAFPVPQLERPQIRARPCRGGVRRIWRSTGAARLAARGALRAGAGLVTIASPRDALAVNAAANLASWCGQSMTRRGFRRCSRTARHQRGRARAGRRGRPAAARHGAGGADIGECAVVLDADALTSFADDPETLFSAIKTQGDRRQFSLRTRANSLDCSDMAIEAADKSSKFELARSALPRPPARPSC